MRLTGACHSMSGHAAAGHRTMEFVIFLNWHALNRCLQQTIGGSTEADIGTCQKFPLCERRPNLDPSARSCAG